MSRLVYTLLICTVLTQPGCLFIGSGGKTTTTYPTLGQQLQELKDARDRGAITEDEYQRAKQRMLDKGI